MNFVNRRTTSERGVLRLPSIVNESGVELSILSMVPLPIPIQLRIFLSA